MRIHLTALALITSLLLHVAPIWARGDSGDNRRGSDSKSPESNSHKGSGGGAKSSDGKPSPSGRKADRNRSESDKGSARKTKDRKWPDAGGRDRDRGDSRRRCPKGRRDCRESCCNQYGYGETWRGWDPVYDGWGFPWPDHPNPGRIDPDEDRIRGSSKNVELRISPVEVEVFVNGIRYSKKGNTRLTLPSGHWTIEIRSEGYLTETLALEIKQGDRYRIERKLRRDPDYHLATREARHSNP